MNYPPKVVLKLPLSESANLGRFAEDCLASRVKIVAISGSNSAEIEDEIDWLVVGDGSDDTRFLVTTAHELEQDALEFARIFNDKTEPAVIIL